VEEGERLAVEAFPILGQSAAAAESGEGAFDDPALGQNDEAFGVAQSLDNLEVDARQNAFHRALEFRPLVASVGVEPNQEREGSEQLAISSAPPSRSGTSAECTIACIRSPCVSTRTCRFALDLLACVVAPADRCRPFHMGCFQSSSIISAL
jgi:hypothetical protein